jgi:ABC-2 type transport system permease protein
MAKLWAVVKREYLERVRTTWFVIATVFGPVVFGALMFLPAYMATSDKASAELPRIRILDATGAGLGRRVATELNGGPMSDASRTEVVAVAPPDLGDAERAAAAEVLRRRVLGYLVLDAETLGGERARYYGSNATSVIDMATLRRAVRREVLGVRLERAGVRPEDVNGIKALNVDLDAQRLTSGGGGTSSRVSIVFALTVAALLYVTIFLYGQNVLRGVMEEKTTRVAEVVVSSVPATRLLAGKVLGVGAVGLTQILIWLCTSVVMFRLRGTVLARMGVPTLPFELPRISPGMVALLLLFFVLGYVFYAALFAAVGAVVDNEQEAQQAQLPVAMLLIVSVAFIQPAIQRPDGPLAATLSWTAFSAPIIMPLRMATTDVAPWDIAVALVAVLAACYIAVFVAARIYRTALLMYGKRPTLGEVWRWVGRAG